MSPISKLTMGSVLLIAVGALPLSLVAQQTARIEGQALSPQALAAVRGVEINAFIGMLNDEPEFRPHGNQKDEFRRDAIFGVRISHVLPHNMFVEAQGSNALVSLGTNEGRENVNSFLVGGAFGYGFWPTNDIQAFAIAGADLAHFRPDKISSETDVSLNGGVGGRLFLTPAHAIRADARMHFVPDALGQIQRDLHVGPELITDRLWALELSIGVSFFPGAM